MFRSTNHRIATVGPAAIALWVTFAQSPKAHAGGDQVGIIVNATMVKPTGEQGRVAESVGLGGEIHVAPDEFIQITMGGYTAVGRKDGEKILRDLYDIHFEVALRPEISSALMPYAGVGLDVLAMTTHQGGKTARGTTLGVHASLGMTGHIGDDFMFKAGASFLGAVVPGTGDDLGGLVLQLGLGRRFH